MPFAGKRDKIYPYSTTQFQLDNYKKTDFNANRKPTDVWFFTIFALFITILSCFIAYCVYNGDIGRVIHGYDNCGTVCGSLNKHLKELDECYKTVDERNFGSYYLVVFQSDHSKLYDRICTNNCSHFNGYQPFFNRCLPSSKQTAIDKFFTKSGLKDFFVEVFEDFEMYWHLFIYMCLASLVISLGFLLLFPFIAFVLVWIILIGTVSVCLGITIYLWISWKDLKDLQKLDSEIKKKEEWTFLALAIAALCLTIIVLIVIVVMIKRIKLVVQLFEEAGKAISAMPCLLLQPILTFISLIATLSLWAYFCLWISSSGYLVAKRPNIYYYRKDGFMEAAKYLNFFGMFWIVQYVIGCQHMVLAGAVAKWYFTRNKSELTSPILHSMYNLTRYHLGTVALGSFLLGLLQSLRCIMLTVQKALKNQENWHFLASLAKACHCCLWMLERLLKTLSRNAYIITAMYGLSFYKAGKQAFTHLAANPLRVLAINSVGDFVLLLSKVLVVTCNVAASAYILKGKEGIQHLWVPLLLIGLFSYFISHCFMTVYEMTIDTIFICFCEDCDMNDGVSKPYFMSRGLLDFVENSQKYVEEPQKPFAELTTISKEVDKEREGEPNQV